MFIAYSQKVYLETNAHTVATNYQIFHLTPVQDLHKDKAQSNTCSFSTLREKNNNKTTPSSALLSHCKRSPGIENCLQRLAIIP